MIVAKSSFGPGFESPRLHHAGATGFDGAPDAAGRQWAGDRPYRREPQRPPFNRWPCRWLPDAA